MPDPFMEALNFSGGGAATMGREPQGYRVLQPGAGAAARGRASTPMGGNRIEPLTTARYPMRPGPAPRSMPALPANQAAGPGPAARPQAPKYDPSTYDPVAEYAKLRGRIGLPPEGPAPPLPVHAHAPATGMAETFMPAAQEQAGLVVKTRAAQAAARPQALTNTMAKVGQYGLEGGLMPRMGTPGQATAAAGMGVMAGAVNNPQAALQAATHPIGSAYGLAKSGVNAVVDPHGTWGPDFTTGMARLLGGEVSPGEMAGAVGDATGLRPVFNAGVKMGGTLNMGLTNPAELGRRFGRGMGAIGNAVMGY
jgi:hypothetical protein